MFLRIFLFFIISNLFIMVFVKVGHTEDDFVKNIEKEMDVIGTEISDRVAKHDKVLSQAIKEAELGTLKTSKDIQRCIGIMEEVVALSEEAVSIIMAAPALMAMSESFKDKSSEEKEMAMRVVKNTLAELKFNILVKKIQNDRTWALTHIKRLNLMKDNPTSWKYNKNKGFIDSNDEKFIKKFNELTNEINRLQNRATGLINKYLAHES